MHTGVLAGGEKDSMSTAQPARYEVCPYTIDNLSALLQAKANTDLNTLDSKLHLVYFEEYFTKLDTRTIVVENEYIDRDYLEDFSGYYVRCFSGYERKCTRLHFFKEAFDESDFSALLASEATLLDKGLLQRTYLGFVVVKPLPLTVIGRTCLATYPPEKRRHFPITRSYEANLFGITLTVESLAFQEQDTVAAACATSALWSAFHGTGRQFHHPIPSPVEITRAATIHFPLNTRTFPNSGLTLMQMADAIRSVGLEPYAISTKDEYVLKSNLYAYLSGHIPILLGITFPTDLHAVTVTGYSLVQQTPVAYPQSNFCLKAFRMDKIYAHDDQIGPFARMEFLPGPIFGTSWPDPNTPGGQQASPCAMLVPLYSKIRIPFDIIFGITFSFANLIELLHQHHMIMLSEPLEWDIYLTNVNTLKSELQEMAGLMGEYRRRVLTIPMPRFIWRASACLANVPVLDLLFDATDIEQGSSFVGVIEYDAALGQVLRSLSQAILNSRSAVGRPDRHVLAWLAGSTF